MARGDPERVVRANIPLMLGLGAKICGRFLHLGVDDEASVGLEALWEAVRTYRPETGAPFAAFAAMVVRRRLIDHYRRACRRREVPFASCEREDGKGHMATTLEIGPALQAHAAAVAAGECREELCEFVRLLESHGITLRALMRSSPRYRDARERAVTVARALVASPGWTSAVRQSGIVPAALLRQAAAAAGIGRKTLERRRRYILAIALLLAEGFPRLAAYLPSGASGGEDEPVAVVAPA